MLFCRAVELHHYVLDLARMPVMDVRGRHWLKPVAVDVVPMVNDSNLCEYSLAEFVVR